MRDTHGVSGRNKEFHTQVTLLASRDLCSFASLITSADAPKGLGAHGLICVRQALPTHQKGRKFTNPIGNGRDTQPMRFAGTGLDEAVVSLPKKSKTSALDCNSGTHAWFHLL